MATEPNAQHGGAPIVVAIGASAGGLQSLRPIVDGLNRNGRTAYLVAHHMAAHHSSGLPELLQEHSRLTVVTAKSGDAIVADHVYVTPPGCDLIVREGCLELAPPEPDARISPSIDRLFVSASAAFGHDLVALVLSGSGTDGAKGILAVRAAGGVVLVQTPEEATQPGMPEAALATGQVHLDGTTEKLAAWLNDVDSLRTVQRQGTVDSAKRTLHDLLSMVAAATQIDLTQYKEGTLLRQAIKRYRSLGLSSLEEYLGYVGVNQDEVSKLQQHFLISVSSFFRDPEEFHALEQALRELIASKQPGESIRIWVPGCATGQEAFSIAMLVSEVLGDRLTQYEVRVFATDVNTVALESARSGFFKTDDLANVDPRRRERFFVPEAAGWRIGKSIRELCVFSAHDVIGHPPFIRMDLISCRNLLIYFKPEQQDELFATFHYALNPQGLLMLGESESAGFNSSLFERIESNHKIYRRRSGSNPRSTRSLRSTFPAMNIRPSPPVRPPGKPEPLIESTLSILARNYGPPSVLVNARFEPTRFFRGARDYLSFPDSESDFSVFSLCAPELRSELKALCYRLVQEGLDQLQGYAVTVPLRDASMRVTPVLRRVSAASKQSDFALLISFEETPLKPHPQSELSGDTSIRIAGAGQRDRAIARGPRGHP